MSDAPQPVGEAVPKSPQPSEARPKDTKAKTVNRIYLISYPKIVFLYPVVLAALAAAIYMSFVKDPLSANHTGMAIAAVVFLGVFAANVVILAFDFPRTTSLTFFFVAVTLVMGVALLAVWKPEVIPAVTDALSRYHPLANAEFYWGFAAILGAVMLAACVGRRFDYWEVRPNELLHHHGVLANLERFPAPNLRVDTEINDVFEYVLLRSGRLVLQVTSEKRAIILDNVPFIKKKERALTGMLSALHVHVYEETGG